MVISVCMLFSVQHQNGYSCGASDIFLLTLVPSSWKVKSQDLLWLMLGWNLLMLQQQELESYIYQISTALTFTCICMLVFMCNRQAHCVCYIQNLIITSPVVANTVSRVWMVVQLTSLCLYKQTKKCQDVITETRSSIMWNYLNSPGSFDLC